MFLRGTSHADPQLELATLAEKFAAPRSLTPASGRKPMPDTVPPPPLSRVLFGLRVPVDRRTYLLAGLALFGLKYLVDAAIVFGFSGELWLPTRYVALPWEYSLPAKTFADERMLVVLAVWALPFAWIGISMTMRRCMDAGIIPGYGLLFFIPIVNYLTIATLCVLPTRTPPRTRLGLLPRLPDRPRALLMGSLAGVVVLVLAMALSVFAFQEYGAALFIGAPFISGFTTAFVLTRWNAHAPLGQSIGAALLALLVGSTAFLVMAWEGLICIAMAVPIGGVLAMLGALVGHAVGTSAMSWSPLLVMLAAWPVVTGAEAGGSAPRERELVSVVEVARPIEAVWPHVIAFSSLPEPSEWFFRAGIAYPVRARIDGQGPGAVRYCEFSTGAFVEPITTWDAPRRLAFRVVAQPPPMTELSPYAHVLAPHLDGNLQSRRGEFRLFELPHGRTRIEARTWYTLEMEPAGYWSMWSDAIIHAIHMRVLDHIAREATPTLPTRRE